MVILEKCDKVIQRFYKSDRTICESDWSISLAYKARQSILRRQVVEMMSKFLIGTVLWQIFIQKLW